MECIVYMHVCLMECVVCMCVSWTVLYRHGNCLQTQISVGVKLTFHGEEKLSAGKRNRQYNNNNNKKEASVLVPHQIPMKHTERVHMRYATVAVLVE